MRADDFALSYDTAKGGPAACIPRGVGPRRVAARRDGACLTG
ncbi:hypothetical protein [Nonomuraea sp. LPB2021202275-12-8]